MKISIFSSSQGIVKEMRREDDDDDSILQTMELYKCWWFYGKSEKFASDFDLSQFEDKSSHRQPLHYSE